MVLEVKNVRYAYKSQKEKEILKNASMQFEEKKFYAIVGASGAPSCPCWQGLTCLWRGGFYTTVRIYRKRG